jgi:hypothetical protein
MPTVPSLSLDVRHDMRSDLKQLASADPNMHVYRRAMNYTPQSLFIDVSFGLSGRWYAETICRHLNEGKLVTSLDEGLNVDNGSGRQDPSDLSAEMPSV